MRERQKEGSLPEHFFHRFKQTPPTPRRETHKAKNNNSTLLVLRLRLRLLLLPFLLSLLLLLLPPELLLGELSPFHVPQKREAVTALTPAELADDSSRNERVPAVVADVRVVLGLAEEVRVGSPAVRTPNNSVSRGRDMSRRGLLLPCSSFGDLF